MKKSFRPSARLISTIGEDIIKDMHAAVVELVKNSYDADAHEVIITFESTEDNELFIRVEDNGHGMEESVVTNKWLVPSTSDKFIRKTSPRGRIMQGRKGIGRFAVAILGENLHLETTANTELLFDNTAKSWTVIIHDPQVYEEVDEPQRVLEDLKYLN